MLLLEGIGCVNVYPAPSALPPHKANTGNTTFPLFAFCSYSSQHRVEPREKAAERSSQKVQCKKPLGSAPSLFASSSAQFPLVAEWLPRSRPCIHTPPHPEERVRLLESALWTSLVARDGVSPGQTAGLPHSGGGAGARCWEDKLPQDRPSSSSWGPSVSVIYSCSNRQIVSHDTVCLNRKIPEAPSWSSPAH